MEEGDPEPRNAVPEQLQKVRTRVFARALPAPWGEPRGTQFRLRASSAGREGISAGEATQCAVIQSIPAARRSECAVCHRAYPHTIFNGMPIQLPSTVMITISRKLTRGRIFPRVFHQVSHRCEKKATSTEHQAGGEHGDLGAGKGVRGTFMGIKASSHVCSRESGS